MHVQLSSGALLQQDAGGAPGEERVFRRVSGLLWGKWGPCGSSNTICMDEASCYSKMQDVHQVGRQALKVKQMQQCLMNASAAV
jgi:hypothetical protein